MSWMGGSPVYHWSSYHPSTPFTYVIKWIKFTSADRTALKQKSYHHLSHIPCLAPLHRRLQPYQSPRHHPPDHFNFHILQHPKTYQRKIIYLLDKFIKTTFNQASPFSTMNSLPAHIHIKLNAKPVT